MVDLTDQQRAVADGGSGKGAAMAMRLVADAAVILGAPRLVPVESAHIDGCLYHGDGGTEFAETLVAGGARVRVPATLNIGSLDLLNPAQVRLPPHERKMALRLMRAYEHLGCRATWTCAPYQNGHRPGVGAQVAWGESNAVVFVNSVLGARTNRYGDYLDIACAIAGAAPDYGLHRTAARRATIALAVTAPDHVLADDATWPALGAILGRRAGSTIAAINGVTAHATEDRLKALGATAASVGEVALFHVVGVTPEAPTLAAACQDAPPETIIPVTEADILAAMASLSNAPRAAVTAVAIGSPHCSLGEIDALVTALDGRQVALPFYVNTSRDVVTALESDGRRAVLDAAGITIVADTCIVATPIIDGDGVLMTNSGKFAHYAPGNINHGVVFAALSDCVARAVQP
ncbi:MAG: aconitase X catalytic domain-containing protein [Pseudomonadota bacterium]